MYKNHQSLSHLLWDILSARLKQTVKQKKSPYEKGKSKASHVRPIGSKLVSQAITGVVSSVLTGLTHIYRYAKLSQLSQYE